MSNDQSSTSSNSTPLAWRITLAAIVIGSVFFLWVSRSWMPPQVRSALGLVCLLGLVASLSSNLRAIYWRTIAVGFCIQIFLAWFILGTSAGKIVFKTLGAAVAQFLNFADEGAQFVFGPLAKREVLIKAFGEDNSFVFAFAALPTIIFISSFFAVLYYFGVLQFIVRLMARAMMFLMGTSGAETLSSAANVFMGQTEAPLIVKPYVGKMTQSEMLALMAGGMATVSGGMLALYIIYGADPTALLATSVMAAPCALYLSKLLIPETEEPATRGEVKMDDTQTHRNAIDAAADGALGGMRLALNVAAVLIAFIALVAMIDFVLMKIDDDLSLKRIFSVVFYPIALLMGIEDGDISKVANLLGAKLSVNELYAFSEMKELQQAGALLGNESQLQALSALTGSSGMVALEQQLEQARAAMLSPRSQLLATYALTGFANFASVGIQIGGIGGIAPERRSDLARLGIRALFIGFLATVANACLVGLFIE